MPIEIMELTVRAQVRDELKDTPCGDNYNRNDSNNRQRNRGSRPQNSLREATESAAELLKRQKER